MSAVSGCMKSVLLKSKAGEGKLSAVLSEVPVPRISTGELLVEMKACGLCGTDIEKLHGEYTASLPVLGHEAVGVVVGVGRGVKGFEEGDRVFPHHHVPCNVCYYCKNGNQTMCADYRKHNLDPSGFSEFFRVPAWNILRGGVLRLPESMDFELGSLIEPLACCVRALDKAGVGSKETVLVVGAGPVGMMHALLLRHKGAKVMVSDINPSRLKFAERLGVDLALDAKDRDAFEETRRFGGGRGPDLVVVASGSPKAIVQALKSARRGGRVCLFGVPVLGSRLDYDFSGMVNSELSIISSYGATEKETREANKMLSAGTPDFKALISHRFPLQQFRKAVEVAKAGSGMKVIVFR